MEKVLKQLVNKVPGNRECADCGDSGVRCVRFASVKLGVFLCNQCFGAHRALGAHITRGKCIGLDTFTQADIALLKRAGNARINAMYEATMPPSSKPPPTDCNGCSGNAGSCADCHQRLRFVTKKYEQKLWFSEVVPLAPVEDKAAPVTDGWADFAAPAPTAPVTDGWADFAAPAPTAPVENDIWADFPTAAAAPVANVDLFSLIGTEPATNSSQTLGADFASMTLQTQAITPMLQPMGMLQPTAMQQQHKSGANFMQTDAGMLHCTNGRTDVGEWTPFSQPQMPFGDQPRIQPPAPARRDTGAVQACPTRSVQQNSFGFGDLLKEAKNAL